MGNLNEVNINKIDGGLGRLADTNDSVVLLVMPLATQNTELTTSTAVRLIQTKDAEELGITESYDANNHVLAHYHVSEIFRLAPDATVYLLPAPQASSIAADVAMVQQTLRTHNEIKGIGFAGFDNANLAETAALADTLQANLILEAKKSGIYIDFVLLEGGSAGNLAFNDYPNLREHAGENISVIIGQDTDIAALDSAYASHAAIGSALGMLCQRQVSENLGSTDILNKPTDKKGGITYPLTDAGLGRFINAGLSTGQNIDTLDDKQIQSLIDRGYIFIGAYVGAYGFYFSGSQTCTSASSDYSAIEYNRVWNKAARLIRKALVPYVKGKVKKDPTTGYILSTTISHWTQVCAKASIERMQQDDDISGGEVYISPKQNPDEKHPLKINVQVVADGIVHTFDVDLSLTNSISN